MKLSLIIPARNEEKRIKNTLDEYLKFLRDLRKKKKIKDFEMLIVVNASTDRTLEIIKSYEKKNKEMRYLNFEQTGKGFALIEGFKDSLKRKNELIGFVDADFSTSIEAFNDLIENIKNYDGIIASRARKGAKVRMSFLRRVTSRGFNFISRNMFFLPYKDTQCGAKLFKRRVIEEVTPELSLTQWAFDINLLYLGKKKGFKIIEHPTIWEDKKESKLNMARVPLLMFLSLVRLRLLNSPFRGFVRLYNRFPGWIKMHHKLR